MTTRRTILVIDDDPAMRDSLAFLLDVNGFAVTSYETATDFLDHLAGSTVDCIVSDIRMPGMSGLELVRKLKVDAVACPVILMTGHGDVALAVEAMKAGAVDFIEKPFEDEALLRAIGEALRTQSAAPADGTVKREAEARLVDLSPRERDVLRGLVAGKINKVIAHDLGISPRTVEVYRANLMAKTNVRSMSELMRIAIAAGL
ncbi:two-component system response regulator FixJ [Bradyrhizobium japonicum]|jgi:two-component system, LuxR family, response regulator FixJ|uniref:Two-component system response regulator FixJ n=2 Tax=Bradyrhizobium elkanii TaxID=29448 RepID=A0ABV4FCD1_BRAEL|nr:response regulator FixJ [Bradyrhizobium elkanii]MDH6688465.1 two-component system response regulator FixJ [Bradyrhizobium elkanii]NWL74965.1 response regulator [Bradyrhizobium elkanii]UQD82535.1 response regulator [Bradyrhizobium elkanii USDA 76]WLA86009.1 response regulator FixJ [Bradyrhizobium elkanii]WLA91030.1 response regulator FixJ [Bradyrhizobium elkanii]